ncbi:MAG: multidrug ABC transporter permease [Firmicutes bacterium HGW-Firmicutes-8]|nr:MAG: multidrug ABC transporter permease [Firmicutes bacterium HGW-Firmicutes-8]
MQFMAILWQEYVLFKGKFWSVTTGSMIGPVLYLIVFGWGLGSGIKVGGGAYIDFVIPGIIALTTMNLSFGTVANDINIARLYSKTFEEFMVSPVSMLVYAAGKITASAFRGLYSAFIIVLLAIVFKAGLKLDFYFIMITLLNCFVFSALGFSVGLIINSHGDMAKFTNFIITPMSFLCGTFFPLDKMPVVLKEFIWILPLTQTSLALRNKGEDMQSMLLHPAILIVYLIIFLIIGVTICKKAE